MKTFVLIMTLFIKQIGHQVVIQVVRLVTIVLNGDVLTSMVTMTQMHLLKEFVSL